MRKDFMQSIQKKIAFIKVYIRIFRLNRVRRGLALESNFYVNPKYRVAYYIIPKVLSSSLCQLMLKDAGIDFEEGLGHKKHKECFDSRLTLGGGDDFTFAFVRNPFARLVSTYKDKIVRKLERQKPSPFDDYLGGFLMDVSSFAEFSYWICQISDDLSEPHFVSQYRILSRPNGTVNIDFIGKFETVEEDWAYIQEKTGLPDLGHFNQTAKDDWRDYYDVKTAKRVYKRYRKDIEAFGYEGEYEKLLSYCKSKTK